MQKNLFIKKYSKDKQSGFTLVETLIAIGILSISILATFTAVQNGLQDSGMAKDKITAFYLAQEGIEYIKNIRDENALNSVGGVQVNWLHGLAEHSDDPCYFGKTCRIDSPLKTVGSCPAAFGSCQVLNQNINTGLFGYTLGGTWLATIYKREIQFSQPFPQLDPSNPEILVTIRMSWTSRGVNSSFQVTESLFNRE